jgi:hypothetical protein
MDDRSGTLILGVFTLSAMLVICGLILALRKAARVRRKERSKALMGMAIEYRGLKMWTEYEAVGTAMMGLLFALLAAWMELHSTMTIHVKGQLKGVNGADLSGVDVFVAVPLNPIIIAKDGVINQPISFKPSESMIYILPVAAGHQPPSSKELIPLSPFTNEREVDLGTVEVLPNLTPTPATSGTVVPLPEGAHAFPLGLQSGY